MVEGQIPGWSVGPGGMCNVFILENVLTLQKQQAQDLVLKTLGCICLLISSCRRRRTGKIRRAPTNRGKH